MTLYPDDVTWTYALGLCASLQKDGVDFTLAVLGGPLTDPQRAQLRMLNNVRVCESSYRAEWQTDDAIEIARAGEWLLDMADRYDVDIVHLNEFAHAALPWRVRPLVTALRGDPPEHILARASAGVRQAGALVATNRTALESVQSRCGRAPLAWVVPFGRSISTPVVRNKEQLIAASGSYDSSAHNLPALARVAPRLSWPVFMLTNAPTVTALNVPLVNVHFLGQLSTNDRMAVLARAGIFVCAARAAGTELDVLEAAHAGCALVLGDVPELREEWDRHAMFVDPDDDESLHGAVTFLMRDIDARTDLASRARRRAATFSPDRAAAAYLAIYIELALRSIGLRSASQAS